MGSGTDVAKNAGRMVLSDDNFATIVYAVEQGRKIYDNLTKYIRFVLLLLVGFVLSFLGATIFNIAGGEPFTPVQVLWIHFIVNAPFGFALGFDQETPGLMDRTPRPRGESVLTRPLLLTVGLVGLAMAVATLILIGVGKSEFGSVQIGISIAFTAFTLMMIVAAFECRSETATVFTTSTFDSKQMNWAALGEFALVVLATQMDALRRILGTTDLDMKQFRWALIPPIAVLLVWEFGKFLARRRAHAVNPT
jgi:Ca2+-transporting ATPase